MGAVVRRYIDFLIILLIPTSLVLAHFLQQHPNFFVNFKNVFSFLFTLFLFNIANGAQRTFEIIRQSRSREHGDIIISTRTNVDCAHARYIPRDVSRKLQLTLCGIMAS